MDPVRWIIWVTMIMLIPTWCLAAEPVDEREKGKLRTVDAVDLERYMGRWYEIAKIPNRFQRRCARDTTATYVLRADGDVDVINRCLEADGDEVVARGIAKLVDRETRAKLKVSFVRLLGIRLFYGKYWIIGLDPDYQWALVGEPKRKYGWILARKSRLTQAQWDTVRRILSDEGYDPDRFVPTSHSDNDPETQP